MFIKAWETPVVKNTETIKRHCGNCDNNSEHEIRVQYYGLNVGVIFMKTPLLSLKKYLVVCPICSSANLELSKEQMQAYKID